jgi:Cu(I)/Ag(I) efflux system membrane fusion protein
MEPSRPRKRPRQGQQPEETPIVEVPTDKQQMIGVRTVKAAIQPMHRVIRTVGRIEFDEKKLATANTKIEGWIEKLHVDYTGRRVQKGEPLAEIFSPELVATQQEFLNTLRWVNLGKGRDERTAMPSSKTPDLLAAKNACGCGTARRTDTKF